MPSPSSRRNQTTGKETFELLELAEDGSHAHIRFRGPLEGREVVWDAQLYALRVPHPVAQRPFFEISPRCRNMTPIRIGLDVGHLDTPTLLKAVIMVRQYKRLRRGRHEFGAPETNLRKIVSGGQTGVDRAALDAAMELGIPCGGWCPKGRRAEDGIIPTHYPLMETTLRDYRVRTRRNVHDADGTLILAAPPLRGGSALTRRIAAQLGKPCLAVDPAKTENFARVRDWIANHHVTVLNIAGPRESGRPGAHRQARLFLRRLLRVR